MSPTFIGATGPSHALGATGATGAVCPPGPVAVTGATLRTAAAAHPLAAFNLPGVRITFDPPHVDIDTAMSWSGAAKLFWNEVARAVGQRPPFGW